MVTLSTKMEIVKKWEKASHFTPREIELLAGSVKFSPGIASYEMEGEANQILGERWESLSGSGFTPEEIVRLMTLPSGHHEVLAILRGQ